MAGGMDKKRRFHHDTRAHPTGPVYLLDPAVDVEITLRISPPPLDYRVRGFAIAYTRDAVLCVWREAAAVRTGWITPADVRRLRG